MPRKKSPLKNRQEARLPRRLVQRVGVAVQIARADGSLFFAAGSGGIETPVWNLGKRSYAVAFARELKEAGFDARVVRVIFAETEALNEKLTGRAVSEQPKHTDL